MIEKLRDNRDAGLPLAEAALLCVVHGPDRAVASLDAIRDKISLDGVDFQALHAVLMIAGILVTLADKALDDARGSGRVCPAEYHAVRNAAATIKALTGEA